MKHQSKQFSKKYYLFGIIALVFIALIVEAFFIGRISDRFWPKKATRLEKMEENLPSIKLPEISIRNSFDASTSDSANSSDPKGTIRDRKNPTIPDRGNSGSSELKVLSANMVGIWDKSELVGLRIIGEIKNISNQVINGAKPVIRFYGNEKLMATKVGNWNEGYQFLKLEPGEINVYDILIPNPPESEMITVEMRGESADDPEGTIRNSFDPGSSEDFDPGSSFPDRGNSGSSATYLKIKEKNLSKEILEKDNQKMIYYKFTGILININPAEIINPRIYVWLKNDQGKVIASAYKTFESDLLTKNQELEVNLLLIPFTPDSKQFEYEVKTWGERL